MKTITKNIIAGAIATTMLLPAVPAFASHYDNNRHEQRYHQSDRNLHEARGYAGHYTSQASHKFHKGERFERKRASYYRTINYRDYRGLRAPQRGYRYVRAGHDILLVKLSNNRIVAVYENRFR